MVRVAYELGVAAEPLTVTEVAEVAELSVPRARDILNELGAGGAIGCPDGKRPRRYFVANRNQLETALVKSSRRP